VKEPTSRNDKQSWIVSIVVALIAAGGVIAAAWHPWTDKEPRPQTAAVDCDRLSSTNASEKARVHFKNFSNRTVTVYWVNYSGAKQYPPFDLGPKGERSMDTFVSHSWCIVDAGNGVPVQAVTVTSNDEDVVIR